MKSYDVSIVICAVRPDKWIGLYEQLIKAVGIYSFELVCVGPYFPPIELQDKFNFTFIRDFGSPSRCFQMGSIVAKGHYICHIPDDCLVEPNVLGDCISFMNQKTRKDGMTIVYSEGPNHTGNQHIELQYWNAWHHDSLRLPMIDKSWKIAPNFMYNLEYFRELGGLDCRWEHVNLNTHDFAFRLQRNGGIVFLSPQRVIRTNWVPWDTVNKGPTQLAWENNDWPLWEKTYSSNIEEPIYKDYNNWRNAEPVWCRRFKNV